MTCCFLYSTKEKTKMKNTMTSDLCSNIEPLSTVISTETSATSGLSKNFEKKKKKTFFGKVKAIFSKSSTEAQKTVSGPFHNAVKNTYVVRENHGTCSNDFQTYRRLNDFEIEANSEMYKVYYGVNVTLTGNQEINNVLMNDDNLVNLNNENMDPVYPSAKNNSSWITCSNTSQETETNCRDIFNEQKTLLSNPVDVGIQTKIPSCYKVYLLHKHVSNCNRRNKSNSNIKKRIFISRDKYKRHGGNKSYYYLTYSSTQPSYTDESHSSDVMKRKHSTKYWKDNKEKSNKNVFNNSTSYHETKTSNIDIELLGSTGKPSRYKEILHIDSNSNIIIDNDDGTTFSGTISDSSSRSFYSTESRKLKYRKTKVSHKTKQIQTNQPIQTYKQEGTNPEESQSKSLPSLNLFRKNKNIKEIKCNSSPLVSQNSIQTKIIKKKESIKTTFVNNSRNSKEFKNTVLQLFKDFHEKNSKGIEQSHKRKQSANKTLSISSEVLSSDIENSNSTNEIKEKQKINNKIKVNTKGNQNSGKPKVNKLKIKHVNSNSTITGACQTNRDVVKCKSKEHNLYQNDIKTKQNQIYDQNDNSIYANPDNLKLNRRPIITQPMIFFSECIKSDTESEMSKYHINNRFAKKENKVRDINMKLIKKQQIINSQSNFIPLGQQYLNPSKVNYNHPITSNTKNHADNSTTIDPKNKSKNHKNKEMENCTSQLPTNKQKYGNFNKKNVNKPQNRETNTYVCVTEKSTKKSNARYKNQGPNCAPHLNATARTSKNNFTSWKPSSDILKISNLTEISFESNLQRSQFHKNKQVNKKTQKNWNDDYSCNNKSNLEKKVNNYFKNVDQERRMFNDILAEKLFPKNFSSNVGVHGAFSGNITSKQKTFFAKITPMHTNK